MTMIIEQPMKVQTIRDGASDVIRSAVERIKSDFKVDLTEAASTSFATDRQLYSMFNELLTEGMDESEAAMFLQLRENAMNEYALGMRSLTEQSTGDFAAYATMGGIMLRRFLPKNVVKETYITEVAPTPHFWVKYNEPYYRDINGVKKRFVDAFTSVDLNEDLTGMVPVYSNFLPMATLEEVNLITGLLSDGVTPAPSLPGDFVNLLATGKVHKLDRLDRKVFVTQCRMELGIGLTGGVYDPANNVVVEPRCNIIKNSNNHVNGKIVYKVPSDVAATPTTKALVAGQMFVEEIFGTLDEETGIIKLRQERPAAPTVEDSSRILALKINAHVSNENHFQSAGVEMKIEKREYTIGHGQHVEASFPEEYLKDLNVLYSIDGQILMAELMADALARNTEKESIKFLTDMFQIHGMDTIPGFTGEFDVRPAPAFAQAPKLWQEEIKRVIDYVAVAVRRKTHFTGGSFLLIGNPIDTQLIPNISWLFDGAERSGVNEVSYTVGKFRGLDSYNVVSSTLFPEGAIYMVYVPNNPEIFTMKYFQYAFSIKNNYRATDRGNLPAVVMMKRHLFADFTPIIGKITVLNNNIGSLTAYR